jgi:lysine-ketoglutarate reductase/saccharopine dehydrogenase-like protein (TIGR00300 family)
MDASGSGRTSRQRVSETVELRGHVIDSGILTRVLDEIVERGWDYEIVRFEVGKHHEDPSLVDIRVEAPAHTPAQASAPGDGHGPEELMALVERLQSYGANPVTDRDATLAGADMDGVFPDGFYSTTNLPTRIRVDGRWVDVANPEMDCGIVYDRPSGTARTIPMDDVRARMAIVCGVGGIRVSPRERPRDAGALSGATFEFMSSEVSSEKPQGLLVERVAEGMREAKAAGARILWVAGPALVHTGSVPATCALIRAGFMDVLFAGNALATHDIEANLFGTSLGVSLSHGIPTEHGHEHHVRAINRIRRSGGIRQAVDDGTITGGIMWHAVTHGVDFVLAGSVRDDGPLPEVIRDVVVAQAEMRRRIPGVGFALMVSTLLHSVATGNMLPAHVPLVCVDINPASVTKLVDRGSVQSVGMVTDVGLFVKELAGRLAPEELEREEEEYGFHARSLARPHASERTAAPRVAPGQSSDLHSPRS